MRSDPKVRGPGDIHLPAARELVANVSTEARPEPQQSTLSHLIPPRGMAEGPQEHLRALRKHIQGRTARIGIIGLGYVGLPLASAFVRKGFPVLGFDVDSSKVDM